MRHTSITVLSAALLIAACGGGSKSGPTSPTTTTTGTGRSMSASIDGTQWSTTIVGANPGAGFIIIAGSNVGGQTTVGLTIATGGTGTQTIGPGTLAAGSVLIGSQMWQANSFGGGGTITLTTVTSNRVAGTFTFTAKALVNSVTPATRVVTSGQFDVTY
jgi:hypothetical protein